MDSLQSKIYLSKNNEKILQVCFRLSNDSHVMYFEPILVNNMQLQLPPPQKMFRLRKKETDKKLYFQHFQKKLWVSSDDLFLENFE